MLLLSDLKVSNWSFNIAYNRDKIRQHSHVFLGFKNLLKAKCILENIFKNLKDKQKNDHFRQHLDEFCNSWDNDFKLLKSIKKLMHLFCYFHPPFLTMSTVCWFNGYKWRPIQPFFLKICHMSPFHRRCDASLYW